jgi:hypothetical protein
LHDLTCVAHLHSTHSDGTGTIPEIARAASHAGVDVVLLTDHDTLAGKDEEGWDGDALVLVGEEVSPLGQNHYLAFGTEKHTRHTGRTPAEVCRAVDEAGGFGFAAHPFSRGNPAFARVAKGMPFHDLDAEELRGIEVWSMVTDTAEHLRGWGDALRFVARPQSVIDHPPPGNLAGWDRLGASRKVVGLGGLDAHQIGKRIGNHVPLRLMSYRRSFRLLHTHVLLHEAPTLDLEHDKAQVYDALREGRSFIALDWVAPSRGFRFTADGAPMGSELEAARTKLEAHTPRPARLTLVKDGEPLVESFGADLEREVDEPGVYRVEARLPARGHERTWILSNPIYLR